MMDEKQRTSLALVLSALILIAWFAVFDYMNASRRDDAKAPSPAPQTQSTQAKAGPSAAQPKEIPLAGPVDQNAPVRVIVVDTPLYQAAFTSRGARLTSLRLKKYLTTMDKDAEPVEVLKTPMPHMDIEGIGSDADIVYTTQAPESLAVKVKGTSVEFVSRVSQGLTITKTFSFDPTSYVIGYKTGMLNTSGSPMNIRGSLVFDALYPADEKIKGYAFQGPVLLHDGRLEEFKIDKVKKPASFREFEGAISWFGVEDKYFLHAIICPARPQTNLSIKRRDDRVVELVYTLPGFTVNPSRVAFLNNLLFVGPKELNTLKAAGYDLNKALDFGFFDFIAKPLLVAMNWINRFVGSYGLTIIVLTVIIKILLYPLTLKSFTSMKELQRIQPLMKDIQNRYKDDKQKMNQELMRLYQEHKINPMGGCLPILLQIPILFALYRVFYQAIELRHTPFHIVGTWLPDLSDKDPYYITPILMGLTQFALQKMTPTAGDPAQQKVMLFMPLIFTFLFLNFPSGLVIYWLVSNLLSIVQQAYINKRHA